MIVSFSGGCGAGKTTFANMLKEKLGNLIEFNCELIRNENIDSIDELRKDTEKYFNIQKKIIREKINQEKLSLKNHNEKIVIFDRSIVDSLFYYTFYLNKGMNEEVDKNYHIFFKELYSSCIAHVNNLYSKIFLFRPINVLEYDNFRPKNIKQTQIVEYFMIKTLLYGLLNDKNKITNIDVTSKYPFYEFCKSINNTYLDKSPIYYYNLYNKKIIEENYYYENEITNRYGSIETEFKEIEPFHYLSSYCFTTDKKKTDEIINCIKELNIEQSFMDSRCYPTGFWSEGNVMIVGEAPGQKGRGINGNLKPSFIFTDTSRRLRYAIQYSFDYMPYITNLLKYAKPNNKVNNDDFKKCSHIIEKEIEYIKPKSIIALGKSTYEFMNNNVDLNGANLTYVMHPAASIYKGITYSQYAIEFSEGIGDFGE
jgi:uracil-DNA glycosylase family 4